ncbi:hypothetical protein AAMO2058_001670500 [Amorphochlora amoebiformis]
MMAVTREEPLPFFQGEDTPKSSKGKSKKQDLDEEGPVEERPDGKRPDKEVNHAITRLSSFKPQRIDTTDHFELNKRKRKRNPAKRFGPKLVERSQTWREFPEVMENSENVLRKLPIFTSTIPGSKKALQFLGSWNVQNLGLIKP